MPFEIIETPIEAQSQGYSGVTLVGAKGDPGPIAEYGYFAVVKSSFVIPASNAISSGAINLNPDYFLTEGKSVSGSILNIDGILTKSGGTITFTRATAGSVVTVPADETFYPTASRKLTLNVETIADLRDFPAIAANGAKIRPRGYYVADDLAMFEFWYNTADTQTDNGGTIIKPNSVTGAGRWNAILPQQQLGPRHFGAKGDGTTNDSPAIQALFNFVTGETRPPRIFFSPGTYAIGTTITWLIFTNTKRDYYVDFGNATLVHTGTGDMFQWEITGTQGTGSKCHIFNGRFVGNTSTDRGFRLRVFSSALLHNIKFHEIPNGVGLNFQNYVAFQENITVQRCHFNRVKKGVYLQGGKADDLTGSTGTASYARFRLYDSFVSDIGDVFFDTNRGSVYNALIDMIGGNPGDNCLAIFRWKGGCNNTEVRNVNLEQMFQADIGTTATVANCTMNEGDNFVTTTVSGAFTAREGYQLIIPGAINSKDIGDPPKDLSGTILEVQSSGTVAVLGTGDTAERNTSNVTATLVNKATSVISSGNLNRVTNQAGSFPVSFIGKAIEIEGAGHGRSPHLTLITAVASDGSWADLANPVQRAAPDFKVRVGTIMAIIKQLNTTRRPQAPLFVRCRLANCLGAYIYYEGGNLIRGQEVLLIDHTIDSQTAYTPSNGGITREQTGFSNAGLGKGGYAYLGVGITSTEGQTVAAFGGLNAVGLSNDSYTATSMPYLGDLAIERGVLETDGRVVLRSAKNNVLKDVLTAHEDGQVVLGQPNFAQGRFLGTMDADSQFVIRLAPTGTGVAPINMVGRIYGRKSSSSAAQEAAVDLDFQLTTNNSGSPALLLDDKSLGTLQIKPVTFTVSSVPWIGISIGGSSGFGLNSTGVFLDVTPSTAAIDMVLASTLTAVADYDINAQARTSRRSSWTKLWGVFGAASSKITLTGNNQDPLNLLTQFRSLLVAFGLATDSTTTGTPVSGGSSIIAVKSDSETVFANTSADSVLFSSTIPAAAVGTVFSFVAEGRWTNSSGSAVNYTLRIKLAGTSAIDFPLQSLASNSAPRRWSVKAWITITSTTQCRIFWEVLSTTPLASTTPSVALNTTVCFVGDVDPFSYVSTSSQTFALEITMGTANATVSGSVRTAILSRI